MEIRSAKQVSSSSLGPGVQPIASFIEVCTVCWEGANKLQEFYYAQQLAKRHSILELKPHKTRLFVPIQDSFISKYLLSMYIFLLFKNFNTINSNEEKRITMV